ncbi:hypothetical protein ABVT39_026222 [Epinephelus coioides]
MDAAKQQWSVKETSCLLALWSLAEVQKKLKGALRIKPVLGRSGNGRSRKNPHFDVLDSVLGDRPACQVTRALNSATAMLEVMVDDSVMLPQTEPDCGESQQSIEAEAKSKESLITIRLK